MFTTAKGGSSPWLILFLSLTLAVSGCAADSVPEHQPPTPDQEHVARIEAELEARVSLGLASELPPPMSREQRELVELTHYRRQVADDMRLGVDAAMTPLAVAAAVFAINGPADLLLAVVPVHKLGKAVDAAREGIRVRRGSRRARKLTKLHSQFDALLPESGKEFLRLAGALKSADRKALKVIHRRVGDDKVIVSLMRKHLDGAADVRWIAGKLEQGKLDRTFVRRYSFDKDIIEDITEHDAHISWRTLQAVVEGETVSKTAREVLRNKLAGLMGERVAHQRLMSRDYVRRALNLHSTGPLISARGVRYTGGSLDIVAYTQDRRAVIAEVKNWAADSWAKSSRTVLGQLRKHERGIEELLTSGDETRSVAARVLIVNRRGYYGWARERREEFEDKVTALGWRVDYFDADRIKHYRAVIDDLR